MWTSSHLLLGVVTALTALTGCRGKTEHDLIQNLLTNYDVNVRPVDNQSETVTVHIGMALNQLINLDSRHQELQVKVWMRYYWTDTKLKWNSSEYEGITSFRIYPIRIWRPDITLYNDLRDDPNDNNAKVFPCEIASDGAVKWFTPTVMRVSCDVNARYYPWDEQTCYLKFGSWTYDTSKLDVVNKTAMGDINSYSRNSEWNLMDISARRNVLTYSCCPEAFSDVTFQITIQRKPLYYIFNLILPALFISIITILMFYLPPESGEKMSLGVTVLLALVVFLLLVAESVPQSEDIPLISEYFGATIIMMAMSACLTVITLNLHHRGSFGHEVPSWVRKLVLDWLAKPLFLTEKVRHSLSKPTSSKNSSDPEVISNGGITRKERVNSSMRLETPTEAMLSVQDKCMLKIVDVLTEFRDDQTGKDRDEACRTDWMLVAMVLDRLFLWVFTLLTILVSVVIFMQRPTYGGTPLA